MSWYEKAGTWLRKWWGLLAGALALLAGLVGVILVQRRQLANEADRARVAEGLSKVRELQARREEVAAQTGLVTAEIEQLDAQILESKRKILDLHQGGPDVPDDQLEAEFARLGF